MPSPASASPATRLRAQWSERWSHQPLSLPQFGVDTSAGWLSRALRCTGPEQDEILTALLEAVSDGEEAAERTLLQLLVPAVDRIAIGARLLPEYSAADRSGPRDRRCLGSDPLQSAQPRPAACVRHLSPRVHHAAGSPTQ